MIKFTHKGDFSKLSKYLNKVKNIADFTSRFEKYGREGVAALAAATPVDTGLTASSWYYTITQSDGSVTISFNNSNRQNGVLIAIILYYGHATRNGGWVEGRDYIHPAIRPVFDKIANEAWREVTRT